MPRDEFANPAPAILPHSDGTKAGIMRKISVVNVIRKAVQNLWAWGGKVPSDSRTVRTAIIYHAGDYLKGMAYDQIECLVDFVAVYIPGGAEADATAITDLEYRRLLEPCLAVIDAEMIRLRRAYEEAGK